MTIGVIVLTLNAAKTLPQLVAAIHAEHIADRIGIVDSESNDGTLEWVQAQPSIELLKVRRSEFNHGSTREAARKWLATDVVVFLTQDVIPQVGWLLALTRPITTGEAAAAYARQLPHRGADIFEGFPREFNYPARSELRRITDAAVHGVHTFFCSDSCAAYLNRALDSIGGFDSTLTNEDYFAVAKLLRAGGAIAYVGESKVHHSHRYSLKQEFQRNFDNGYVRAENPWVTELVGKAERRGSKLAITFMKRLIKIAPHLVPYAVLQLAAKWLGYRVGHLAYGWPRAWCRRLSAQQYYWNSSYCKHPRP